SLRKQIHQPGNRKVHIQHQITIYRELAGLYQKPYCKWQQFGNAFLNDPFASCKWQQFGNAFLNDPFASRKNYRVKVLISSWKDVSLPT
ncbi:MAG: hypothetical protein J6Y51_05410, partial [Bacteroidaceae bacterium]|nr:hypothetical protein [Bacteroidaceae bacterium]